MYLVYCKTDGEIFREVENYRVTDENWIEAGMGGEYKCIYPADINADVIEVSNEDLLNVIGQYDKYKVTNNNIVFVGEQDDNGIEAEEIAEDPV